jgi:hypothetical protein
MNFNPKFENLQPEADPPQAGNPNFFEFRI